MILFSFPFLFLYAMLVHCELSIFLYFWLIQLHLCPHKFAVMSSEIQKRTKDKFTSSMEFNCAGTPRKLHHSIPRRDTTQSEDFLNWSTVSSMDLFTINSEWNWQDRISSSLLFISFLYFLPFWAFLTANCVFSSTWSWSHSESRNDKSPVGQNYGQWSLSRHATIAERSIGLENSPRFLCSLGISQ